MFSPYTQSPIFRSPKAGFDIEGQIAKELQRQKGQEEAQRRQIEKILAESDEIRQFKSKIKAAYLNKERSAQIADHQLRRLEDIVSSCSVV